MARQIHTRWKITGTLKAETPIHVGGMGGDADTDLALAVNGKGNYYIPGTSLAGALRTWMGQILDEDDSLKAIWGDHENDQRGASFIIIENAEIQGDSNVEIREGVGIDRHTGAAADGQKYNRAILPKGIKFPLNITFDRQNNDSPNELWQLLLALEKGDIRIGAAKTRGLGKIILGNIQIQEQELHSSQGIFDTLLKNGYERDWETLKKPINYKTPAKLDLNINWKPKDPVMVKAEGDGIAVDILPLVSQVDSGVRFVIPGSSIKGVLRAHAERIVRTVCQREISENINFLEQVKLELVNQLFGAASNKDKERGFIGVLGVDDCYAKHSMNSDHWAAVENAEKSQNDEFSSFKNTLDTALQTTTRENPFRKLQPAMHVAIDRWTGGAADGMLYSVLEPIGVEWEEIGIHLDLERLKKYGEANVQPAIALLLLVLRDFANRKIPIGYGTNRGMGTVSTNSITCHGANFLNPNLGFMEDFGMEATLKVKTTPETELLTSLFKELFLMELEESWQHWITNN